MCECQGVQLMSCLFGLLCAAKTTASYDKQTHLCTFTAMSAENDNNSMKFEMKSLCIFVLLFELACERIFTETVMKV